MNSAKPSFLEYVGDKLDTIRAKSNILLVGVTGGIASGKSTAAHMLEEMGALTIDFDILARQAVEQGKPAWKKIVDYFGKDILQDEGSIDRKRLSRIVFSDKEKRRMLESFIHPVIAEYFVREFSEIASKEPDTILQAVVPLLIEGNMQEMFHKIVVVHIPREKQIERLMKRDGISRDEALDILNAQMHIDQKIKHAHFVIYNENSLETTKKQIEDLWSTLKGLQKKSH